MDEHLSAISAKMGDRLGLEHSVVGVNHTTDSLGKHFPKETEKTSMVNRRGLAVEGGVSKETGYGFQGELAGVLGWSSLLSGNAAASKAEGFYRQQGWGTLSGQILLTQRKGYAWHDRQLGWLGSKPRVARGRSTS